MQTLLNDTYAFLVPEKARMTQMENSPEMVFKDNRLKRNHIGISAFRSGKKVLPVRYINKQKLHYNYLKIFENLEFFP
jgi:hypothetical protein